MSGSAAAIWTALSAAQRAVFRASTSRWPTRSMRKDSMISLASFRLRSTGIERSAKVSGSAADNADGDRRVGGEGARLVVIAHGAQHAAAASMSGIQDAAQIVRSRQERIGLVDQQGRAITLDDAEQRRRGHVCGRQRLHDKACQHVEQRGLAAPLHRRANRQPRRDHETVEQIGMGDP